MQNTRILFVCLGNICRSPLAEGVMRQLGEAKKLNIKVDSAGTANYHVGEEPDARSIEVCRKHGVDISGLRGRQFGVKDFDNFDLIYAMDTSNLSNIKRLARTKEDEDKVELLLNLTSPDLNKQVPDPYYGGPSGFDSVYNMVEEACQVIAQNIQHGQ